MDQLQTGLTTNFVFTIAGRKTSELHLTTIQIRYELWDEQYLVATLQAQQPSETLVLGDPQELRSWWSGLEVAACGVFPPQTRRHSVRVSLQVIPFSDSEKLETQEWFADSVRQANRVAESESSSALDGKRGTLDRVLDSLIATSIRSRPMIRLDWTLDLDPEPQP